MGHIRHHPMRWWIPNDGKRFCRGVRETLEKALGNNDPHIRCQACGGSQSILVTYGPFNRHHALGCPMQNDLPQHPKQGLVQILETFPREL